jgi:UDP-2-acetamido-3-amino-2,3-dideoxy-glucuronate N-acetyltransferase
MIRNKICVVGGGSWGKNHIKTLNKLGVLSAIVEKDQTLLRNFEKQYANIDCFTNIDKALEKDYNGFIIATPAETHFALAKKIIQHKRDLLVEKPLTLSIEESEFLVNLSKKNNVSLMVGHVLLFHPAIIKIKEMIDSGSLGKLQYIYSNRLNLGKVRTEENVFWSLAPHDISIFQYFIESYPLKIKSTGSTFLQKEIFDSTITTLEYKGGVSGHVFVSWLHPFKEHRLVVVGSEAMISFEDSTKGKPLTLYSKKINIKNGIPEKIDGPKEIISYDSKMPLDAELEYFVNEKKPIVSNGQNGLDVVKILVEASQQLEKK